MLALADGLKTALTGKALAVFTKLTCRMLSGRSGEREFGGVRIVAALGRRNGIACGARLQCAALRQLGVDADLLDATSALRNPLFRVPHRPGSVYIFHSGGPQTATLVASVLPQAANAYRIAYWAWELPDPPLGWVGCDCTVSEVWTPSAFSKASLARLIGKPIHVVPHHVPPGQKRQPRGDRRFTVLAMADSRSSLSRKNPEGALRAFRAAFGTARSVRLVLKLSGRGDELQRFVQSLGDLSRGENVELVQGDLDELALSALYREADVFLSLHRAEGFGLPMREAMAHGVPVVATAWSGNREFMDGSNGHLVPYTLVPVSDRSAIYAGSTWAEPDLGAAARALRRLAEDPDYYDRLAEAAYAFALEDKPRFPFTVGGARIPAANA